MRWFSTTVLAAVALASVERICLAQGSPTTRNGVATSASSLGIGSGTFGTSATTGGTGSAVGANGGGVGSNGLGSIFGVNGSGISGAAQGGANAAQMGNGTGFIGANNSANNFIGGAGQAQQGGARQTGAQNRGGNARGGNNGAQNLLNLLGGMGGGAGGQTSTAPVIRPRQKVAFDFPAPPAERLQTAVTRQVSFVSKTRPQFKDIQVTAGAAGEIVLTGSVASERDSRLAAKLARLEPGVRNVRNELTFPPSTVEE